MDLDLIEDATMHWRNARFEK